MSVPNLTKTPADSIGGKKEEQRRRKLPISLKPWWIQWEERKRRGGNAQLLISQKPLGGFTRLNKISAPGSRNP